jgi:hypothetical protein
MLWLSYNKTIRKDELVSAQRSLWEDVEEKFQGLFELIK